MLGNLQIEAALYEMLNECLEGANQDGSILELKYDPESKTCTVKLTVEIIEEDNYIGFQGY